MSQTTLEQHLRSILTWMRETESTVSSSQDSFNSEALTQGEATVIIDTFTEVLSVQLRKKHLAMMIKSVKLLMTVTLNLKSSREKLPGLLESLLVNIMSHNHTDDEIKSLMMHEFLVILENCLTDADVVAPLQDFLFIISAVANENLEVFNRTGLLKTFNRSAISKDKRKTLFKDHQQDLEVLVDCLYSCGDYDMQTTVMETLMTFTCKSDRMAKVNQWFPNYVKLQSLFTSIKDFEPDCRNFLNLFNEGLANQRLVWSFTMMSCSVEGQTLTKPGELAEFWVDFNLGPGSVSLYYTPQDQGGWQLFTLTKSQAKKIQARWEQGRWKIFVFCSQESTVPDVVLEFARPGNIPELIQKIFSQVEVDKVKESRSGGLLMKKASSASTMLDLPIAGVTSPSSQGSTSFANNNKIKKMPKKMSVTKKAQKSVWEPKTKPSVSGNTSDALSPASSLVQKKMSLVRKPLKMTAVSKKKPRQTPRKSPLKASTAKKVPHQEIDAPRQETVAPRAPRQEVVAPHQEMINSEAEVVFPSPPQTEAERPRSSRTSKTAANAKIQEIQSVENNISDVPPIKQSAEDKELNHVATPPDDHKVPAPLVTSGSGDVGAVEPVLSSDHYFNNRLSYSGRRVRAQRKPLKRKTETADNIDVVKKKISFGNEIVAPAVVESDGNPVEVQAELRPSITDDVDVEEEEPNVDAFDKEIFKSQEDVITKSIPQKEATRRSSAMKVLFSQSRMESEMEDDDPQPLANNIEEKIPSYDDIYKKPSKVRTTKAAKRPASPAGGLLDLDDNTGSNKFFKTPSSVETSMTTSSKKRVYQRKSVNAGPSKAAADPFSFPFSPPPKPKRQPKAAYGQQQRKKKTVGSKRRSEKMFSDDSDQDSPKTPAKTFPDYTFVKHHPAAGDSSTSLHVDKSTKKTKPSQTSKKSSKEVPKKTLVFLEHITGVIDSLTDHVDGVSRIVLKDISFFITEKCDMLVVD